MKTSISIASFLLLFCSSCMDYSCMDWPMPHEILSELDPKMPHEILFGDDDSNSSVSSYSSREYCNVEPRILVDHHLSEEGLDFVQSFEDNDELKFVPLGTAKSHNYTQAEIWTWKKTEEELELIKSKKNDLKCENDPDRYEKTVSNLRGANIKYVDDRFNQATFIIDLRGVFDCVNGVPVGIQGELFCLLLRSESQKGTLLNFFTNNMETTKAKTSLHNILEIKGRTYRDIYTADEAGPHYQIFFHKTEGVAVIHDLATNSYWEPMHSNVPYEEPVTLHEKMPESSAN